MVLYKGRWHSVRKTIVGDLVDKSGKRFQVRFLVDSGATVSLILMHALYMTKGEWDVGVTPKLYMHGINAVSYSDLMLEAKFIPGDHVSPLFKESRGLAKDFGLKLQFFVQRGVKAYRCNKLELPDDARFELLTPKYTLADPDQASPGEQMLYVHGIIGEDQISLLEEAFPEKVGNAGLRTTRSHFGDMIHGNSHFIKMNNFECTPEMKESPYFYMDKISVFGLIIEMDDPKEEEDSKYQNLNWLLDITE